MLSVFFCVAKPDIHGAIRVKSLSPEENNKKRYFHSIKRGFDCYTLGLEKRGEQLITSYVIDKIDFNKATTSSLIAVQIMAIYF